MILIMLSMAFATVAVLYAYWFGGMAERYGAKVIAAMYAMALAGRTQQVGVFHELDPVAFAEDLIGFAGFSLLGIYTKRVWPLWAAAFQLLSVGAHFVRMLELDVRPIVYAWMKSGPTWAVLVLLLIGTLGHRRRTSSRASGPFSPS
ncbi:hypothetical protein H7F50_05740 [Novosphingobium flavum]|uniref:Uncharacterized protein n=1 Tax=Novosphingobium aerophilum TaxID=2839843 RepID=A0A7X1F748_9SPHN|nr:hypothetical protein [Novosphingobium aerophilum]MBC2651284.1 hypothetical protein [Novosphingobium aerophilum]MBC2661250.1 hypothetical protein [Novosphingobium aerophilum]